MEMVQQIFEQLKYLGILVNFLDICFGLRLVALTICIVQMGRLADTFPSVVLSVLLDVVVAACCHCSRSSLHQHISP